MKLKETFEYIRKTFFPRWDKNNQWTVKVDSDLPLHGLCKKGEKIIILQYISEKNNELYLLLIHEICHATTDNYHAKKWCARMLKVAEMAEKIGHEKLSKMIQGQVKAYKSLETNRKGKAAYIYEGIQYAVFDAPTASYKDIIKWVGQQFGYYPEEIEESYKLCKKVYDKAVKDIKRMKHLKQGQHNH